MARLFTLGLGHLDRVRARELTFFEEDSQEDREPSDTRSMGAVGDSIVDADTYAQYLARFKQNEKPEAVLVVANEAERIRIAIAWTNLDIRLADTLSEQSGESEGEIWNWLWENSLYSVQELMARVGVSLSEATFRKRLDPLIGNRVLYPDGTVNSFVQRYLRECVLKLLDAKPRKPAKSV